MNKKRIYSNLIMVGGIGELLIALVHFIWPTQLVHTGEYVPLSADYTNLLVLTCMAVGLCLTVFGILSIYSVQGLIAAEKWAWAYGISQGILWELRALLEIIFPVRIPLFFVTTPTLFILPFSVVLGLLFLIPLWVFRKDFIPVHNAADR